MALSDQPAPLSVNNPRGAFTINAALKPPSCSWWATAPPSGFYARCCSEWVRMHGSKFALVEIITLGPSQKSMLEVAHERKRAHERAQRLREFAA